MSAKGKPDPARGFQFVEKLLAEDDLERFDKASDEEVERQMREQGVHASHVPSADEMIAKAAERAARRMKTGPPAPRIDSAGPKVVALPVRSRRPGWVAMLAAAALGVLVLAVFQHSQREDDVARGLKARAAVLRADGLVACSEARWPVCEQKLDEARGLDAAGETEAPVIAARKAIFEATHSDAGATK